MYSILVIAGETSGDQLAADFVHDLNTMRADIHWFGFGGDAMKQAGVKLYDHVCGRSVNGFFALFRQLPFIWKWYKKVCLLLDVLKPDLVILVDYPGFNLRIARRAKALHIPVLYYVSPQIWAWRRGRIHQIKQRIDHMAVLFPFEKSIYQKANIPVSYVGHPLFRKTEFQVHSQHNQAAEPSSQAGQKLLLWMPGSRRSELKQLLPIVRSVIEHTKHDFQHALALAPSVSRHDVEAYLAAVLPHVDIYPPETRFEHIKRADLIMVASGTATLELCLLQKPMVVMYKIGWLTYHIAKHLVRIPHISLCNILAQKCIVPERIQHHCTAEVLIQDIHALLHHTQNRLDMIQELQELGNHLKQATVDTSMSMLINQFCPPSPKTDLGSMRREYGQFTLDQNTVPRNPLVLFQQWLEEATHKETCLDPNAMVLSTSDSKKNVPDSRIVLLKSINKDGQFIFYTHKGSPKSLTILNQNANVSLLFYWPALARQVRIQGIAHEIDRQTIENYFASRPRASQIASLLPIKQSQEIPSRAYLDRLFQTVKNSAHGETELSCPLTFTGFAVSAEKIEFWQGRDARLHDRVCYHRHNLTHEWCLATTLAP